MDGNFTDAELFERASLRVAMVIRGMWEEKGSSDTRLLEPPLLSDDLTLVGHSLAYDGKGHREHVVPRLVIIKECHAMLARGETDAAIAKFIRDHVRIVKITQEECERLDRTAHTGLRQKMPEDWVFGGDLFARLRAAGIEWAPVGVAAG